MRADDRIVRATRIDFRLAIYDWVFARQEAKQIDEHWEAQRRLKPKIFDGRILLAHEITLEGETLKGAVFETSYRNFLCWRALGCPGTPVNLFAMAALRSADGAFLLGAMSEGTANGGKLYFPAGTPEPGDIGPDGRLALEANVLRELEEETGLTPADVSLDRDWTIVFSGPNVACMRVLRSPKTAAALQEQFRVFNRSQPDPELSDLAAVWSPDDFDSARTPGFVLRYLTALFESGRDR